jgi:hypothetical protein
VSAADGAHGSTALSASSLIGIVIGVLLLLALIGAAVWVIVLRGRSDGDGSEFSSAEADGNQMSTESSYIMDDTDTHSDFVSGGVSGEELWADVASESGGRSFIE